MDAVDRQLIQALRENGRASYAELGRLVGLSGPSVTDRINRLEAAGVITGYRATVDAASLGLGVTALIGVSLSDAADHEDVAQRLKELREIEDCWFIAGDDSYMLKVPRRRLWTAWRASSGGCRAPRACPATVTTIVLSTKWENRVEVKLPEGLASATGRRAGASRLTSSSRGKRGIAWTPGSSASWSRRSAPVSG
ncbi:hypothetical protein SVIOM342S_07231 [Streptomyces violaceorubidus]